MLDRAVDCELPEDELVNIAVNRAIPLVQHKPSAPFSFAVRSIAAELTGETADDVEPQPRRRFALGRSR